MEKKNILDIFAETVNAELDKALATARANAKEGETVNAASIKFNIAEVFKALGATYVRLRVQVNKDYTWLRVETSGGDGFYHPLPSISQHKQATKDELDTVKTLENVPILEATCTAGIAEVNDGEEKVTKRSFKWDELIFDGGDIFAFTGKTRKWDAAKGAYDGPVAE